MRILLLGGTTEASNLAVALVRRGVDAVFSYAGRTAQPVAQPLPTRLGGFGGVAGLVAYVQAQGITHIVDATHPFAAQMSRNAVAAGVACGVQLLALERKPWASVQGDEWLHVPDIEAAVEALPDAPTSVFLAIGKQNLAPFAAKPQHFYLLRLVDRPDTLPLPNAAAVIARGPFDVASDTALLQAHAITHIVAKNAGGIGAEAKLTAARALGLRVILIDRPVLPPRQVAGSVAEVMAWLGHSAERGV
jgi:precorrin-6A/cobalt-precorrin-6A reductase